MIVALVIFVPMILLTAGGTVALYQLGKEDPRDPALPKAWEDRVERRMDAIIDRNRPQWANRLRGRFEAFADQIGWR